MKTIMLVGALALMVTGCATNSKTASLCLPEPQEAVIVDGNHKFILTLQPIGNGEIKVNSTMVDAQQNIVPAQEKFGLVWVLDGKASNLNGQEFSGNMTIRKKEGYCALKGDSFQFTWKGNKSNIVTF